MGKIVTQAMRLRILKEFDMERCIVELLYLCKEGVPAKKLKLCVGDYFNARYDQCEEALRDLVKKNKIAFLTLKLGKWYKAKVYFHIDHYPAFL